MNRKAFYAALRRRSSGVFGTSLSQSQVAGIEGILDAFVTHGDGKTAADIDTVWPTTKAL